MATRCDGLTGGMRRPRQTVIPADCQVQMHLAVVDTTADSADLPFQTRLGGQCCTYEK